MGEGLALPGGSGLSKKWGLNPPYSLCCHVNRIYSTVAIVVPISATVSVWSGITCR